MNHFPFHIGDYTQDTCHLTFLEDAAYSRLLRKYYATERPLPADVGEVQRLMCCRSKVEKKAVQSVLNEFFELDADGWHNARADAEIAKFRGYPPSHASSSSDVDHQGNDRQAHHREAKRALREKLRAMGVQVHWDAPMSQLRQMLDAASNVSGGVTGDAASNVSGGVTGDAVVNQNHNQKQDASSSDNATSNANASVTGDTTLASKGMQSRVGQLCIGLRSLSIDVSPGTFESVQWKSVLGKLTNEQIIEMAASKRQKKVDQRMNASYLLPGLEDIIKGKSKENDRGNIIAQLTSSQHQPYCPATFDAVSGIAIN